MRLLTDGVTRLVVLAGRRAYKLPRFDRGWKAGLTSLLANLQEAEFGRCGWPELCPVSLSIPGGFLVVMPRADALDDAEWVAFDPEAFIDAGDRCLPVEPKRSSFGWLDDRIVALDYGS